MFRCINKDTLETFNDDGVETHTSIEQKKVESSVQKCFDFIRNSREIDNEIPKLYRNRHLKYLRRGLQSLPQSYQCLDSSRPWLTYWITHSMAILNDTETLALDSHKIIEFLSRCRNDGGYGGGPNQISHLATTYAAINALVTLANKEALNSIDRDKLKQFLYRMKQKDGSFTMHTDGEIDIRGAYCAASVASITGLCTKDLFESTSDWIIRCQTYEGGFGGSPGGEAHGGYTFCGIAALVILGAAHKCDLKSLLRWVINKQQKFEGGFAGRTNKLVDGCYSFWQGSVLPIIHLILTKETPHIMPINKWLFHQQALQEYLLCCCQESTGGLIDKPGRHRDFYHTCYDLSGLSIAQHSISGELIVGGIPNDNRVVSIHPVYNITSESVRFAAEHFSSVV